MAQFQHVIPHDCSISYKPASVSLPHSECHHTVFKTFNDSPSKASNMNAYALMKMLLTITLLTTMTKLSKIGIMIINECIAK